MLVLLLYEEALGFRVFLTAVFGFAASGLASPLLLPSPAAFFAAAGRARAGFALGAGSVAAAGTTASAAAGFCSPACGIAFFTFFGTIASSLTGAGAGMG